MFSNKKAEPRRSVPRMTHAWAKRLRKVSGAGQPAFCIGGQEILDRLVASEEGLLPLIAWHADKVYSYAMGGFPLGLTYRSNTKSMIGFEVDLSKVRHPASEVMCFFLESLEDIRNNSAKSELVKGAVDLTELVKLFKAEMKEAQQKTLGPSRAVASP